MFLRENGVKGNGGQSGITDESWAMSGLIFNFYIRRQSEFWQNSS